VFYRITYVNDWSEAWKESKSTESMELMDYTGNARFYQIQKNLLKKKVI